MNDIKADFATNMTFFSQNINNFLIWELIDQLQSILNGI